MPRFFKRCLPVPPVPRSPELGADQIHRLFKFPQMDFEMAIWEMTSLLIAPKKVFKSIYYHVSCPVYD
jgi:UNC-50 family.